MEVGKALKRIKIPLKRKAVIVFLRGLPVCYMFGLNMHSLRTPLMQRYLYRFVERKRTDIRLFDGLAEKFFNGVSVVAELARIECFEFLGGLAVGFCNLSEQSRRRSHKVRQPRLGAEISALGSASAAYSVAGMRTTNDSSR